MIMNQKEENLNGCAALTKTESEGIDTDIEALKSYICDNICQYREKTDSQEALEYYFCSSCEIGKRTRKIKAEYDKINHFDHSQAMKLMDRYKHIVLCQECEYLAPLRKGYHCYNPDGPSDLYISVDGGCSFGKRKE